MPLTRVAAPFSHGDWLFELKYDGFRALAYIEDGDVSLVSRRGNAYKSFPLLTAPPQYKITDDVFASAVDGLHHGGVTGEGASYVCLNWRRVYSKWSYLKQSMSVALWQS